MMQREVAAIVLCILAQAASAQCVAPTIDASVNAAVAKDKPKTTVAAAVPAVAQPPARAELIKTAAAGTRDDAPPSARESARPQGTQQEDDHPRRGSTAMLLAALALMSGIALRRYSASNP